MARSKGLGVLRQWTASEQNQSHYRRRRRGPKPKSIRERELRVEDITPIRRPERSWSQRQKIRVLVFLYHHRIPVLPEYSDPQYSRMYRPPTQEEAASIFCVPQQTISRWVKSQSQIEEYGLSNPVRSARATPICRWPELESNLYKLFLERRAKGQAIRRGWFRIYADDIFRKLYPDASNEIFRFSNGWFQAFLSRYRVSIRCITKKAQKVPEDYHKLVITSGNAYFGSPTMRKNPALQLARSTYSVLAQLHTGHGFMEAFRQTHTRNDKCECGKAETTSHIILDCPKWEQQRTNSLLPILRTSIFYRRPKVNLQHILFTFESEVVEFIQNTELRQRMRWRVQGKEKDEAVPIEVVPRREL